MTMTLTMAVPLAPNIRTLLWILDTTLYTTAKVKAYSTAY